MSADNIGPRKNFSVFRSYPGGSEFPEISESGYQNRSRIRSGYISFAVLDVDRDRVIKIGIRDFRKLMEKEDRS